MQKGSAQLFLILIGLVVILGGGYYYFNSTKLQVLAPSIVSINNKQETYTNQDLGFEFKYNSKDLNPNKDNEEELNRRGNGNFRKNFKGYVGYEPGKFTGAVVVLDKSGSYDQNPFTIWVFDNPDNLTIDQWYKNYWYYPFVWGDFTYTGKTLLAPHDEATISGQMAKSGVIDYQPGKPKFIYLAKDKKIYLFRIIGEIGDKLLATFKFLQ